MDGRIVAMAPERGAHLRIKGVAYRALDRAVTEAVPPCQALPDDATAERVKAIDEPDALVNRGSPMAEDAIAAPNPVIVVDVLSPGAASTDTGGKLAGYCNVPSISHHLIFHPIRRAITHHRRAATGIETRIVFEAPIVLAPPGLTITLEAIYGAATAM